ncbi:hypothetical protein HMPREF0860_1518 [Treponema socranskii subsp. socranskii VPI DR56BR1116 = ATCC 35536]|uniref:Uncharacterized protein n=1 Tax=Treponema socranskii subsp. socranskii VPI DR56BR1116 = ATCC 35536 TaxID=1125725 RepID=U2MR39_TRESO|nr:hypothetical protein HMPREF1325_2504 [Treponema socranskii subsp. socranskii VPI DR56BR1116 = ATCC 35536]ERK04100.1 hypothetical protein HMPREF0860_1518 [Treponema socranskii subsp. socranskii VPI DR56BR1116 = ATCC 35536]
MGVEPRSARGAGAPKRRQEAADSARRRRGRSGQEVRERNASTPPSR